MFCERCGAKNPDDANVCISCGHPIPAYARMAQGNNEQYSAPSAGGSVYGGPNPGGAPYYGAPSYAPTASKSGKDITKYIKPAIIVVAVIIVISLLSGLFGGGYKKPIKKMVKYAKTAEADYFFDAFPKNLVDELDRDDKKELEEFKNLE